MGHRTERTRQYKFAFRIKFIIILLTIILFIASIAVWIVKFYYFYPQNFIMYSQIIYICTIGFFYFVTASQNRLILIILKSFIKISFSVWIISFVLISSMESYEQNVYVIFLGIFIGYFEAFIEIHDFLNKDLQNVYLEKLKYINKDSFNILSRPFTILIISIIHIIMAFFVSDFIKDLTFPQ